MCLRPGKYPMMHSSRCLGAACAIPVSGLCKENNIEIILRQGPLVVDLAPASGTICSVLFPYFCSCLAAKIA